MTVPALLDDSQPTLRSLSGPLVGSLASGANSQSVAQVGASAYAVSDPIAASQPAVGSRTMAEVSASVPTSAAPSLGTAPTESLLEGAKVPPGVNLRALSDVESLRSSIYQSALEAASSLQPLRNDRYELALTDVRFEGKDRYTPAEEKKAVLTNTSLVRRLRGTWELRDATTGKVLAQRRMTVANIPYVTRHGTYIRNGVEYGLNNQSRLLPGVFVRRKENGEIEAHAAVLPGQGFIHRYYLDPEKQVFQMQVQQARLPLLPILRLLGAKDEDIRQAWGPRIFESNLKVRQPSAVLPRIYQKIVGKDPHGVDAEQMQNEIRQRLADIRMDPQINQLTLGTAAERLTPETILAVTRKLIAVARDEADTDDRDDLANQQILGAEDLLKERIQRDTAGELRQAFFRISFGGGDLKKMPTGVFDKAIDRLILKSGLGHNPEEINPAEMLDRLYRITRMGSGGIGSTDAIPEESRGVLPSHLGMLDLLRTPESERVGVDLFIASGARKGSDNRLYSRFRDVRTGEVRWMSPHDLRDKVIAFPGSLSGDADYVEAIQNGQIKYVDRRQVDVEPLHFEYGFSPLANLIPLKSTERQHRVVMGSRMLSQAVALVNPESQLVQNADPDTGRSYSEIYGEPLGAVRATEPAIVKEVDTDYIVLQNQAGQNKRIDLYRDYVFNRKSFLTQTPLVKPGDVVRPGALLAKSNYTDDQGRVALGINARVAFIPFRSNYEDAFVVSQSFADRMRSQHAYQETLDWPEDSLQGLKKFRALFDRNYNPEQYAKLDDKGVVKPGQVVNYGDPLTISLKRAPVTKDKIHRVGSSTWQPYVLEWKHQTPGVVTDVVQNDKGVLVVVKTEEPLQVGDKISQLYGGKGVVSEILPDDQMPKDADGVPVEVVLDPSSLISRGNTSQAYEALLGALAEKTGKPYVLKDFEPGTNWQQFVESELKKHGKLDRNYVIDPETNRRIDNVLTGKMYFLKLHHMAEYKAQGRGLGSYTSEGLPSKADENSSKRNAAMHTVALLSHGALDYLRDAKLVRGQRNDELWSRFMAGYPVGELKVPEVYEKFLASLTGSGLLTAPDGPRVHLKALTNSAVAELAGDREIRVASTVRMGRGDSEDYAPIPGGLFDPQLTGGHDGNRWSYIQLDEPFPNPVMVEPIRQLLGLTQKKFEDILFGKESWNGVTGPKAIYQALAAIDVGKEIERAREQIRSGKKSWRDAAIKKLMFLKASEKTGVHPVEWMLTRVPVLPPRFRPISKMESTGLPIVSDPNYLYMALIDARDNLRALKDKTDDLWQERQALYRTLEAVVGLGDPIQRELREKNVKGLLGGIFSTSPKFGMLQRKLISMPVDLVGRAVIVPDPDLDMDHVGLPEEKAWNLYQPFIIRRLRQRGLPLDQALDELEKRTPLARSELLEEMQTRPVVIDRAPVLHKLGMQAAWPKLTKGNVLRVSPLITKGFAADFDGNCVVAGTRVRLWLELEILRTSHPEFWQKLQESQLRGDLRILRRHGRRAWEVELAVEHWPLVGEPQSTAIPGQKFYALPKASVWIWSCDWQHPDDPRAVHYALVDGFTVEERSGCCRVETESGLEVGVSDNPSLCLVDPQTGTWRKVAPKEALGSWCPVLRYGPEQTSGAAEDLLPVWEPLKEWLEDRELFSSGPVLTRAAVVSRWAELHASTQTLVEPLRTLACRWLNWSRQTQVYWDRIKRVTPLPDQTVYDFLVPATQVFAISSGLVVYDTMNFHVPFSEEAIRDAVEKLMPSRNLISAADFSSPTARPQQMYLAGLFLATRKRPSEKEDTPVIFRNSRDAIRAFLKGEISATTPVRILQD